MRLAAYLTHPLGPKYSTEELFRRQNNVANAIAWVKFVLTSTPWSIMAPWIIDLMALDEEIHQSRLLVSQLEQLRRADVLLLLGGMLSPHMRIHQSWAMNRGISVIDATDLGATPPEPDSKWERWLLARAQPQIVPRGRP